MSQPLQTQRQVATEQVLDHTVEPLALHGVAAGLTERREPQFADPRGKIGPCGVIEQRSARKIFRGGLIGEAEIRDCDPVGHPALDKRALVNARM